MKWRSSGLLVIALLAWVAFASSAKAGKRIALLVGNASYAGVSRLDNPVNDVDLVAAAFVRAGFDRVDRKYNLPRSAFVASLRSFEDEASTADIAIFYFSGH